jgi:hypothetical protein
MTPTSALVPAAARGDAALGDVEAVLNSEAIEVFAKCVGGRDQLADTLAVAGTGSEIERITTLLLDPRYASWSLARLCQVTGITVADLFASYRKALIARAHIESSHIIAGKLPGVVTDVMDKAISDPTVERHKLALEVGQLLEKKGGLIVQQNNMAANLSATAPGSLEQLQQAVGDLLFGGRQPDAAIDVDQVRDTPPAEIPDEPGEDDAPALPFSDPREMPVRSPDLPSGPEPS